MVVHPPVHGPPSVTILRMYVGCMYVRCMYVGCMYVAYELISNEPNWPDMRQDCGPIDRCPFRYEIMPLLGATKRLKDQYVRTSVRHGTVMHSLFGLLVATYDHVTFFSPFFSF